MTRKKIAYIIPYKHNNKYRTKNLIYILNYTLSNFNFLKIYLTEQGESQEINKNINIIKLLKNKKLEYNFIKSKNNDIDRGHIFNCTIKHFLKNEKILIMGDADIPLLHNIYKLLYLIETNKFYFVSPYTYLSKLNKYNSYLAMTEKKYIMDKPGNIYTFSGGILIVNREIFEKMGIWYEFNCYGNEDRALDVIIENYYENKKYIDNFTYIHLWHPSGNSIQHNKKIKNDLFRKIMFGCIGLKTDTIIHQNCKHITKWTSHYQKQIKGDLNKYN